MAKILVTEQVHPIGPGMLEAAGHQVVYANRDMDIVRREIVDADAVFVRIVPLTAELLATAKNLKLISKHGVGLDGIDLEYCKKAGIPVTTAPNANSRSVAEHAAALMVALAKNIIPVTAEYKRIGFAAKDYESGMELSGKTLGLIGIGRIGTHFARICRNGFDMRVLAYDPYAPQVPEGIIQISDMSEVVRQADVLSVFCPLTPSTRHIIDREHLNMMKPSALFINCARGALVDEPALIEALKEGKLAGAGLDVTDPEPIDPNSPLLSMHNVIVTPHYAPSTREAALRVSKMGCENILAVFAGREPVGRVV